MSTQERREQLSVPVPSDLRRAIERAAQAEDRTVASWVRRQITAALEQQGEERAA
jgi:uncharacterized protein (DUF1778 family)